MIKLKIKATKKVTIKQVAFSDILPLFESDDVAEINEGIYLTNVFVSMSEDKAKDILYTFLRYYFHRNHTPEQIAWAKQLAANYSLEFADFFS